MSRGARSVLLGLGLVAASSAMAGGGSERSDSIMEIDSSQIVLERLGGGRATLRLLVEPLEEYEIALRERPSPFAEGGNWWKSMRNGETVASGTFDFASFDADEGSVASHAYVALGKPFVYGVIHLPDHRVNIGPRLAENGTLVQTLKIADR